MKKSWQALFLGAGLIVTQLANAQATGYSVGFEYEAEKEKATGVWSDTGFVIPAIAIEHNALLDKVELLLGYAKDRIGGPETTALGLRLRKNIEINHQTEAFVRAAVGHDYVANADYNWGYIEPGIEFKLNHTLGLGLSDRLQNSIDGTSGKRTNSLRVGPNIEFNDDNELELRYIATTGDYDAESYMAEYILRF